MVYRLSHRIDISYSGSNCKALKRRFHQITSLTVCERAKSSASMLDIITVFYLVKRQSIGLLNSLNKYLFILYLVTGLSAKAVFLA
jgi:hypothetical protein